MALFEHSVSCVIVCERHLHIKSLDSGVLVGNDFLLYFGASHLYKPLKCKKGSQVGKDVRLTLGSYLLGLVVFRLTYFALLCFIWFMRRCEFSSDLEHNWKWFFLVVGWVNNEKNRPMRFLNVLNIIDMLCEDVIKRVLIRNQRVFLDI